MSLTPKALQIIRVVSLDNPPLVNTYDPFDTMTSLTMSSINWHMSHSFCGSMSAHMLHGLNDATRGQLKELSKVNQPVTLLF